MGVLLALASALGYGLSDFLGGVLSRRASFVRVALLGQLGGLVVMALAAPLTASTPPRLPDVVWGALSGLGTGIAMMFLFRGMSRGAMSVVVPVSAVGGVALPVLVATAALGERPPLLGWVGIALALPALWLVSGGAADRQRPAGAALRDGLVASVGIALQYLALAQATPGAGVWPVAAGRLSAVITVAVLAQAFVRTSTGHPPTRPVRLGLGAGVAGSLAALALVCYLFATRTQFLAVAVVLSSLYPVVPVLLGITALRERLRRRQILGLVGALAASVLIATS
jgi:drug/metabolite transporter (DMT)-like permease